jgi:hypothetical protein
MLKLVQTKQPVRLQMAVSGVLKAEVIVESMTEADRIWARWSVGRYRRGLPQGSACMNSMYMDRLWDVPVGTLIK